MTSETIRKLEPEIRIAADMIKKAMEDRTLIILRHHADCDGYCAALALEEVMVPVIQNQNIKAWQKYKRLPMKAPFYDYTDALKDIESFRIAIASGKRPLLIMADNGSGEEDLLALKRVKQYGVDVIVIDHHVYSEEVKEVVDLFINSRMAGDNGDVTAGILCYEIAQKLGSPNNIYPALSSVTDKSSEEVSGPYIRASGKTRNFLEELGVCFDFEAYNLGFMESDNVYDFFNEKQEKMIKLLLPEIKKKNEEYRLIAQKFLQKDSKIFWLDLEKTTSFGDYPTAGKVVGIVHRINKEPRATIGLAESFLTYRIDGLEFSVKEAIAILRKKIPHGRIWGGGHDYAGTIKFIPAVKEEVRSEIRKYINS